MPKFACLALAVWALAPAVAAQDLVLTNANILDPSTRTVVRGALWIEGGRIIGRGAEPPASARGARIDVGGRWVIPGLVDLHTHSFGNFAPPGVVDAVGTEQMATRVLRAGVTAFLDLFSDENAIFAVRDRQRAGAIGGAEIFAAGPCITATKGHCSEYGVPTRIIDSPADARRHVDALAAKRPDVVKVVYDHAPGRLPSIDRPTLEALIAAARERGLKTVVHVGTWEDARHAALAGASAITHVPSDGVVPDDVPTLMVQRKTLHIPTMTVHADMHAWVTTPALLGAPLLAALAPETIRNAYRTLVPNTTQRDGARASAERTVASVRRLHAAGVPMLAGTDAGNPGVVQGFSVHRELIQLAAAGLSPWDALAAATTKAGGFLGRRYGVNAGDDANLVVVDKSPLDDIANTQQISLVVMRGQIAYRK